MLNVNDFDICEDEIMHVNQFCIVTKKDSPGVLAKLLGTNISCYAATETQAIIKVLQRISARLERDEKHELSRTTTESEAKSKQANNRK